VGVGDGGLALGVDGGGDGFAGPAASPDGHGDVALEHGAGGEDFGQLDGVGRVGRGDGEGGKVKAVGGGEGADAEFLAGGKRGAPEVERVGCKVITAAAVDDVARDADLDGLGRGGSVEGDVLHLDVLVEREHERIAGVARGGIRTAGA